MEQVQKKKKKKGWIAVVIVVVLLAGIGGGIAACSKALSDSIAQMGAGMIEVDEVERRDITNDISVSGQVQSENMVKITSTLTAKVKTLHVEVGQEVKEGDLLCEFDSTDLQTQYDALLRTQQNAQGLSESSHKANERNLANAKSERESALAQAQRAIDDANAARDNAHKKEKELVDQYNNTQVRMGELRSQAAQAEDPLTAETLNAKADQLQMTLETINSSLESIRDSYSSLDSAVQTAQDAYASADRSSASMIASYEDALNAEQFNNDQTSTQDELQKLKDMIDQCTVRAPKAGIITSVNVAEGSLPTTEALMTIENTDALKITVSIAEADILKIHQGLKAIVKTNATGDKEISATVSRVVNIYSAGTPSLTGTSESGGYSAEITIDDKDTDLLIGMN
ncbi:MAG: efflux RND transporter periplasmic adaptor subunit, partial [Oscillospiraceae bacterium]|nr:efflux RND transporter periplasmic adaptor subunit [Oscillospiraceae bacterium]